MTPNSFIYESNRVRVLFGAGRLQSLPGEAARMNLAKLLVLTTPQQKAQGQQLLALLGNHGAALSISTLGPIWIAISLLRVICCKHNIGGC
jgi:maleylacetate reductase